jgi:S-adenosylmethionine uptake transporter
MALLANFLFASSDAIAKALTARYPVLQVIAMNALFACVPLTLVMAYDRPLRANESRSWGLLLLRSLIGAVGAICFLYAMSTLPMAEVYSLAFTAPLIVTLVSAPILGEAVGWKRLGAVAIGFVGVLVMIRPGFSQISVGHVVAFGCAFTSAGIIIVMRLLSGRESRTLVVAAVLIGLVVIAAPGAVYFGHAPEFNDVLLSAASGVLFSAAQFAIVAAVRLASAASVAPIQYTMLVWGLIYGSAFYGDTVEINLLMGSAIVIASSIYLLHHEQRLAVVTRRNGRI